MPYDFTTWVRSSEVEQTTPLTGSVTGEIPSWLRGSMIINGPGKLKYGKSEYKHIFDGAAYLQKVEFKETGPVYTSKFVRTNAYKVNTEQQAIVVAEFGTTGQASKGLLNKIGDKFSFDKLFSDNAPVNLVYFGGEIYANTEAPFLHKIDPKTLETTGKVDLHKELGINSQCPNPMRLSDGSTVNILHEVGATGPRYGIVQFDSKQGDPSKSIFSKPKRIGTMDTRWKLNPCHLHSFGMSTNYLIIPEQPLTIDVKAMVANSVRERPFIEGMEWKEGKMVKIRVFDKRTGKEVKIKYKTDPFYFVNVVNCFEINGHIVMDICAYKKPTLLYNFFLEKLRNPNTSYINSFEVGSVIRLALPLEVNEKAGSGTNLISLTNSKAKAVYDKKGFVKLTPEVLCEVAYENPTFNNSKLMKSYRYFYGSKSDMKVPYGGIGKLDCNSGKVIEWGEEDLYSTATVFVPRPGSEEEDDGVVLVTCVRGVSAPNESILVILDSKNMQEMARISFQTQSQVPRCLHGIYIP